MKRIVSDDESGGKEEWDLDKHSVDYCKGAYNLARGTVNDTYTTFMLDSGALTICMPDNLVKKDQWLPKTMKVMLGNADRATLQSEEDVCFATTLAKQGAQLLATTRLQTGSIE